MTMLNKNGCDGIYNSFDVHFTSRCDNECEHCIDMRFSGMGVSRPDPIAIIKTITDNQEGFDDVLFLGGEPCLYLDELITCCELLRQHTKLKLFITTAVPKICHDQREKFEYLLSIIDGINLSVQHNDEFAADEIRCVKSKYDRQAFYDSLPFKEKIRINLNIVKPYLYTESQIMRCIKHYDGMGFNSIKLSEIQHGKEYFVSFADAFGIKMGSPYFSGCQSYLDNDDVFPGVTTPVLLKRSCFACEETLKASFLDGVKVITKAITKKHNGKYGVVYGNGTLTKGWV